MEVDMTKLDYSIEEFLKNRIVARKGQISKNPKTLDIAGKIKEQEPEL